MYTFEALQILIFLIPGFISATILNILVFREEKKEFEKIIEALIFSMIIYTIHSFASGRNPIVPNKIEDLTAYSYDGKSLSLLILLSIGIPVALGFLVTNDYHMKLARKLSISEQTARRSVWRDVFSEIHEYIIVEFENGRRIRGWPLYYSNSPDKPYIFLSEPTWIEEDEKQQSSRYVELDAEGILITPEQKIESILFLRD